MSSFAQLSDQGAEFLVRWQGKEQGPYPASVIEAKLAANEIGLQHEIFYQGKWVSIRDYIAERETISVNTPPSEPARYVTCQCQYCNGGIEFDASGLAEGETSTTECPHCHLETVIYVPPSQTPPPVPSTVQKYPYS
jgi:hypothetical protein